MTKSDLEAKLRALNEAHAILMSQAYQIAIQAQQLAQMLDEDAKKPIAPDSGNMV